MPPQQQSCAACEHPSSGSYNRRCTASHLGAWAVELGTGGAADRAGVLVPLCARVLVSVLAKGGESVVTRLCSCWW